MIKSDIELTTSPDTQLPPVLLNALNAAVGAQNVITNRSEKLVYDCDGLTLHKTMPGAVVFTHSTEEVSKVVKACVAANYPYLARGAGTGLSGGAMALNGAVVIELARMNKILEINAVDGYAIVEPGVINVNLTKACSIHNMHYAPDPSSQGSCTVGGNVAENSGGPHTLKYGVTTNHIIGLEVVLPSGEIMKIGGPPGGSPIFMISPLGRTTSSPMM